MHLSSIAALFSVLFLAILFSPIVVGTAIPGCLGDRDKDDRPRLNCTAAGFRQLPTGIEPTTKVLLFPRNFFTEMSWMSFTVFTEIYEIDLSENQIPALSPSGASPLPSLGVLRLGLNQLQTVPDHCFSGTPALTELHLQNNLISSLHDQSFSGLSKLEILDLSNNHIQTLPPLMMHPLTAIETLYLEGNKLKVVPDDWFSQKEYVPYLYLSDNPWACSCSLGYLRRYMDDYDLNVYVRDGPIIRVDAESVICDSPVSLQGQSVIKLEESDFCGSHPSGPEPMEVATRPRPTTSPTHSFAPDVNQSYNEFVTFYKSNIDNFAHFNATKFGNINNFSHYDTANFGNVDNFAHFKSN
ncbi:hypothetical protein WMY93_014723 [Mugilogobius chulae]|uniref:LRRCT domain-containing protein n=1 Tax=Mugilogobius chulae TaxID=88201 RepID=A0AAW0NXQ3_9GOBI